MFTPWQCRAARALLNLDQRTLAREAGVAESTLRWFEQGKTRPNKATRHAIQKTLEIRGIKHWDEDGTGCSRRDNQLRDEFDFRPSGYCIMRFDNIGQAYKTIVGVYECYIESRPSYIISNPPYLMQKSITNDVENVIRAIIASHREIMLGDGTKRIKNRIIEKFGLANMSYGNSHRWFQFFPPESFGKNSELDQTRCMEVILDETGSPRWGSAPHEAWEKAQSAHENTTWPEEQGFVTD
jgi:transcriptional regulator with XRE-family HTH domain